MNTNANKLSKKPILDKEYIEKIREVASFPIFKAMIMGNWEVNEEQLERQKLIHSLAICINVSGGKEIDELDRRFHKFKNDRLKRMIDAYLFSGDLDFAIKISETALQLELIRRESFKKIKGTEIKLLKLRV